MVRPVIAATTLGAAVGLLLAAGVLFARADGMSNAVSIEFQLLAGNTDREGWHNRDLDQ